MQIIKSAFEKAKTNKGFTLVELIIVIAIIAVLVAVIAPQYLSYVERGRESNDLQVAASIIDAAVIAVADPANGLDGSVVVTWDIDGDAYTVAGSADLDEDGTDEAGVVGATTGTDNIIADIGKIIPANSAVESDFAINPNNGNNELVFSVNYRTGQVQLIPATGDTSWASIGLTP